MYNKLLYLLVSNVGTHSAVTHFFFLGGGGGGGKDSKQSLSVTCLYSEDY